MEAFSGKWKVVLDKTEGVAEIGKLFGWTEEKQKMFSSLEYTMLLEPSGDSMRCFLDYGAISRDFTFKLGEPFEFIGADGSAAKCIPTLEGGKLKESYVSPEGVTWQNFREVQGDTMIVTTIVGNNTDAKCIQQLAKV